MTKKSSQLLREIRSLAGENATEGLLRTLWQQRMPTHIQEMFLIFDGANLNKLTECADKLKESFIGGHACSTCNSNKLPRYYATVTNDCRPSNSFWMALLHLVPKKQFGMWRPYEDYRGLNAVTTPDRYLLLPHIHDLANHLHGKHVFTTLLVKAYHQVAVLEEDIPKSAVSTPFDLFEFITMPFGLRNAAQTFQRFMNQSYKS